MFLLQLDNHIELTTYLRRQKWITDSETIVAINKAGEGNMNCVLRVDTGKHTLILKQSRAWVEKYPQIAAPAKRTVVEGLFYSIISSQSKIRIRMPGLIGLDAENNILALEDLGASSDFSYLYTLKEKLTSADIKCLIDYLHQLHSRVEIVDKTGLANREMKLLNHEHIFDYPFREENGFDLDAVQHGLQAMAMPYKKTNALKDKISNLGSIYLSDGEYLLHGDFYPGSWLKTATGIKIIDAEFCFYGAREFDLGVLMAHLMLTQHDEYLQATIKKTYPDFDSLDHTILNGFTGTEILRRLIGLAQLPLRLTLPEKEILLKKASDLILI